MYKLLFGILFIILSFLSSAKEDVIWRVTDWPPMYILDGPDKGKGLYDELITMYLKELPQYNHKFLNMNTQRAFIQMDMGVNCCHTSVIMRDVKGKYPVSKLNSLLIGHQIIIRSEKIRFLENSSVTSLEKLIQSPTLRGGIASFGTHEFLKKYENDVNKLKVTYLLEAYDQLIDMLFLGRVDYIIQYAPVAVYREKVGGLAGQVKAVNIEETLNKPYVKVYTACSDTEVGREIINTVNKILTRERQLNKLEEIQLRWYDRDNQNQLKEYYKKEYALEGLDS